MLNVYGLKRKKSMLMAMAEQNDSEFNEVLQAAVKGVNKLLEERGAPTRPPTAG